MPENVIQATSEIKNLNYSYNVADASLNVINEQIDLLDDLIADLFGPETDTPEKFLDTPIKLGSDIDLGTFGNLVKIQDKCTIRLNTLHKRISTIKQKLL